MIPSVQPGSTVTTIQGAYLSDEVGAEASVQRRMRYQPGPLVPRANSRYRFSLEIRQMLDVGYILSGFGAGAGALEFMIIRTIGPLLLPNSTRRPVMNAQRTRAAKARGVKLGTPANLGIRPTWIRPTSPTSSAAAPRATPRWRPGRISGRPICFPSSCP